MIRERKNADGTTSYQLVVYAGLDDQGRSKYVRRTLRGVTRTAARKVHAQLEADVGRGVVTSSATMTVSDLEAQWWPIAEADLSPSTARGYKVMLDNRIRPHWGRTRIGTVKPAAIEQWYAELRDAGLSLSTIRNARSPLSAMFNAAHRWGYIATNPFLVAKLPTMPRREIDSPETEVVTGLLAAARSHPDLAVFVRLGAATGARRGELAALRWADLDLDDRRVTIARSLVHGINRTVIEKNSTKTRQKRRITIDPGTVTMLRALRARHVERALAAGIAYPTDAFVFPSDIAGEIPVKPNTWSSRWQALRDAAGVTVRFHDLRHHAATLLTEEGVDMSTVQERHGWSNLVVPSLYIKARNDEHAADILGAALDS